MKRTWALLFIEPAFVYNSHPLKFSYSEGKIGTEISYFWGTFSFEYIEN